LFFRLLKWFVLITVILLVIGILVQVFLPKGREASPARPGVTSPSVAPVASGTLKPGDSAVLRHSDLTIGNGVHLIADPADIAAFRASQARMKDPNRKSGAGADHTVMYKAGKIRLYGDGYLVRVLNVRPDGVEVEITDGEDKGKRGWAIPEEVGQGHRRRDRGDASRRAWG